MATVAIGDALVFKSKPIHVCVLLLILILNRYGLVWFSAFESFEPQPLTRLFGRPDSKRSRANCFHVRSRVLWCVGMFHVGGLPILRCFIFDSFKALRLFWLILLIGICRVVMPLISLLSKVVEFCRFQRYGDTSILFEYMSQSLWLTSDCFGILVIRMIDIELIGLERVGVACCLAARSC
jgi:hypothetical protein